MNSKRKKISIAMHHKIVIKSMLVDKFLPFFFMNGMKNLMRSNGVESIMLIISSHFASGYSSIASTWLIPIDKNTHLGGFFALI